MAYNSLSVMGQRPYLINNGYIKKKESDEESPRSNASSQSQEEENVSYQYKNNSQEDIRQKLIESRASQQKAIASRDANLKNATINIAQILKDFKNTIVAIGTTPELAEEVNAYLDLVQKQVEKENPDVKIVRSNLKNASTLLDNYITETLQRPSKVVENWIDALFLQQINYKFNEAEINQQFLVKFPNHKDKDNENPQEENQEENSEEQDESKEEDSSEKNVVVPQDEKLKNLFIQAKKYSYAKEYQKAMTIFKQALDRAEEVEDVETESKVLFEIGKIYDKHDYLAQALTSYNKSLNVATDVNVKTKAHYSMAQIYDDVAQFESAINHYMSSISYAGESENFIAQTTSLVKIGNIYIDEYKDKAFDFLSEAEVLAKESKSAKTKGYVSGHIADAYNKFNKPKDALNYYSDAVKEYQEADMPQKVAVNYKRAAELMQDYRNDIKAKKLYKKALVKARQTDDVQLMKEIHAALNSIK